jgi:hypothetical protein
MEQIGIILASSLATALIFFIVYGYVQFIDLKDQVSLQENFILNLRKDIENLYTILEKSESALQNDIRRHIEDLREDFNHKSEDLSNKNMFDYLNQASSFFNSFVDKNEKGNPFKD